MIVIPICCSRIENEAVCLAVSKDIATKMKRVSEKRHTWSYTKAGIKN
jgi:hypothetical protein